MNVAGISSTQEGPKFDFVFFAIKNVLQKFLLLAQSVKVPLNPKGKCS